MMAIPVFSHLIPQFPVQLKFSVVGITKKIQLLSGIELSSGRYLVRYSTMLTRCPRDCKYLFGKCFPQALTEIHLGQAIKDWPSNGTRKAMAIPWKSQK